MSVNDTNITESVDTSTTLNGNITTNDISLSTTKFVFPTSEPGVSQPSQFFELGFVIGMSLMGGFVLMIALFMIITAIKRAVKEKRKKPLLPVVQDTNNPVKEEPGMQNVHDGIDM